jgi:streptomycin 6-kinase
VVDDENFAEAAALRSYAGDGAALLYAADDASGALLLERLEPGTPLQVHPDRETAIDLACALYRRLRRPVPPGHPFPLVTDLARRWLEETPEQNDRNGRPLRGAVLEEYLAALRGFATPAGDEVLVNRDSHLGNVLAAEREPWLVIDPKPLVGEPAFDGGWLLIDLLRPAPRRDEAHRLAERIAAGAGVDPDRLRAWAMVRAAQNVIWSVEMAGDASDYLALTTALSRSG